MNTHLSAWGQLCHGDIVQTLEARGGSVELDNDLEKKDQSGQFTL